MKELKMDKNQNPTAVLKMQIKASTGYSSKEEHHISLDQWADIQKVLAGVLSFPRGISVKDSLPENGSKVWAYSTYFGWRMIRFSDRNFTYGSTFKEPCFVSQIHPNIQRKALLIGVQS